MVKVDHDTPRESEHPMSTDTATRTEGLEAAKRNLARIDAALTAERETLQQLANDRREAVTNLRLLEQREERAAAARAEQDAHSERVRISREERAAERERIRAHVAEANAAMTIPTHVVVPEGSTVRIYESNAANDHQAVLTPGTYELQQSTSPEGRITAVHAVIPATAPEYTAATALLAGRVLAWEKRGGADQYGLRLDSYHFQGAPAEAFGYGWIY